MRPIAAVVLVVAVAAMVTGTTTAAVAWLVILPLVAGAMAQPGSLRWGLALAGACVVIAAGDLASYVWVADPPPIHYVAIATAPAAAIAHAIVGRLRKPGVSWSDRGPAMLVVGATVTAFAVGCWAHHEVEDCRDPFVATTGERICDADLIIPISEDPLVVPCLAFVLVGGIVALGRPRSVGAASAIAIGTILLGIAIVPLVTHATRYLPTGRVFDLSVAMIGVGAVANVVAIRRAPIPRARVS